jgi:hypothetical protein
MLGQYETYEAGMWAGSEYGAPVYDPMEWASSTDIVSDTSGGVSVASGSSWLDIAKSVLSAATSVVTTVLKPGAVSPTTLTKTASGATVQPLTAGLSSPLILGALGLAAIMMLRGRKKGKRR